MWIGAGGNIWACNDAAGHLVFQNNSQTNMIWIDQSSDLGIGIVPGARLHVKQSANFANGGIRVERVDTADNWTITVGSDNNLFVQSVSGGFVASPTGDLSLMGTTGHLTYLGSLNNFAGAVINAAGQFVSGAGINTAGQVIANEGFGVGNTAGMLGTTTTFATGDGRTATVRGGLITAVG